MSKAQIVFNLLSYWHMGSGSGDGASVDALVVKTPAGLPYIPGRTVKGLLREGVQLAEDCGQVEAGTTLQLFGGGSQDDRFGTKPGKLFFTNADLGQQMETWAATTDSAGRQRLFRQLSATSIDECGQAKDQSLRRIEVAIPMQLEAEIEIDNSDSKWLSALQTGATLIRQLGVQRHRGLGRVQIQIKEVTQ